MTSPTLPPNQPAPDLQWRMLEIGEIIQPQDEVLTYSGEWHRVAIPGPTVAPTGFGHFRTQRANTRTPLPALGGDVTCHYCGGTGWQTEDNPHKRGGERPCHRCKGSGKLSTQKGGEPCRDSSRTDANIHSMSPATNQPSPVSNAAPSTSNPEMGAAIGDVTGEVSDVLKQAEWALRKVCQIVEAAKDDGPIEIGCHCTETGAGAGVTPGDGNISHHLFWHDGKRLGSGFVFGDAFKAWAKDFPPGTKLIVTSTARIELPEPKP